MCHAILLLIDNAPGNFETFQRENVVVRLFLPNVTNWKQPCDLGVFVKKRNKFLVLKDVLSFYQLDNDNKQLLQEQGSKFRSGSVGDLQLC